MGSIQFADPVSQLPLDFADLPFRRVPFQTEFPAYEHAAVEMDPGANFS